MNKKRLNALQRRNKQSYAAAVKVKLLKAEREFEALPEVVANAEAAAELITKQTCIHPR